MFKLIILARRIPGLSRAEFIEIYESSHVALVKNLVARGLHEPMPLYRRNYLVKDHSLSTQGANMPDYDVVVESCFKDEAGFRETMERIAANPAAALEVQADFAKFLDVATMYYCVVEVREGGGEG